MFPSLAIFSGAGSTLDMQTAEPLKPESVTEASYPK